MKEKKGRREECLKRSEFIKVAIVDHPTSSRRGCVAKTDQGTEGKDPVARVRGWINLDYDSIYCGMKRGTYMY